MTKLFQLLLLALIPILFTQCSKEKNSTELEKPSPKQHPIVGKWDWDYSQYPFSSDSVIASPDSIQRTLDFRINDTVYEETFYKGILVPAASKSMHYEIIMNFDGMDSVPALTLDGSRYGFGIYSDLLLIDMSRNDQGSHWYIRN